MFSNFHLGAADLTNSKTVRLHIEGSASPTYEGFSYFFEALKYCQGCKALFSIYHTLVFFETAAE